MAIRITFICSILLTLASLPPTGFADTLYLKNGQKVEGEIVKRTEDAVYVGSSEEYAVPYWLDEIERIEESPAQAPSENGQTSSSAKQRHRFRDEGLGISFSVPAHWSENRSLLNKAILAAFEHSSKTISSGITLLSLPPPPWSKLVDIHLLDFAKMIAPQIQVLAGANTIPQPKKVSVGSKEVVVTSSEGIVGGLTTVVVDYSFLDSARKRIYSLRFNSSRVPSSSQETFDSDKSDFLSVVESFAIR